MNAMLSLRKIDPMYLSAVLFAVIAMGVSLTVGFIVGISWEVVVLRAVVFMLVFAAVGYGSTFVLKKYVPELYELIAAVVSSPDAESAGINRAAADIGPEAFDGAAARADLTHQEASPSPDGFKELEGEKLAHYTTAAKGETKVDTASGKLGKHVIQKERLGRYEPKLMAQAVRTMMGRDRD